MSNNQFTILIVDDSATTRAMIKRIVHMADPLLAQTCEATNGVEGLTQLKTLPVDLVLADLNMPVMDGFDMITAMRADPKLVGIPIVVISAAPDQERVEQLKRNGVAAYLPKPFTAEQLYRIVVPLLKKRAESAKADETSARQLGQLLTGALAEALETMAFISPEPIHGADARRMPDDARLVRIHFKGPDAEGSLALAASPAVGAAMVSNIDIPDATAGNDALKELANITCGLILRQRPGGGVGFHLDPPQLFACGGDRSKAVFTDSDSVTLAADGELITAQIVADSMFYGM